MDEFITGKLRENEEVLWEGKPKNIQLFEKACKGNLFTRWAISLLVIIAAGAYAVYGNAMQFESSNIKMVSGLLVICAIGMAIAPIFMKGTLEKNYKYFITNQRFISYKSGLNPRVDWREIDDVKEASIEMIDEKYGNIFIGPKNKAAYKSLRTEIRPDYSPEFKNQPLTFSSVEDAMDTFSAFPKSIKVDKIKATK